MRRHNHGRNLPRSGRAPTCSGTAKAWAGLARSAIAKVKGNVSDKDAFRAALKAADFQSVRGSFKFGTNHFPVQDLHVFEAYKDGKGRMNLKTIATPQKASVDAYAGHCPMK